MPRSHFSIIQFVPDSFADERVNIGLVVIGEDSGFARAIFPEAARRAQRLAATPPIGAIERLRRELDARSSEHGSQQRLPFGGALSLDDLVRYHDQKANALQFTDPKPSSAEPAGLLKRLEAMYLRPLPQRRRARGVRAVRGAIRRVFATVGAGDMLQPDFVIRGSHDEYTFTYGLVNGSLQHVIQATSFQKKDQGQVRDDLYSTAYQFEDLRRNKILVPMSLVVAATPVGDLISTARSILTDVQASLVLESELEDWAKSAATAVTH